MIGRFKFVSVKDILEKKKTEVNIPKEIYVYLYTYIKILKGIHVYIYIYTRTYINLMERNYMAVSRKAKKKTS